jgi:hypothetical protein
MDADQILAFRLARSGLAARDAKTLAAAAACPASDFSRDAALLALGARLDGLTREAYDEAVDSGDLVLAHVQRGAIHALAPGDLALYGRALLGRDDDELGVQLGQQMQKLAANEKLSLGDALDEVAGATTDALKGGRKLGKNELHEELRQRVRPELMPWCRGCKSHHVAPMLWRFATVKAGVRLESGRRYVRGKPGRTPAAREALLAFLGFYGPAKPGDFAEWAGIAKPHAQRIWDDAEPELSEAGDAWMRKADRRALGSPPAAEGIRLIPPGDPYLQKPNRRLLAPDDALRKRLFRPVASPGAVLKDGRLVGLWRAKARGKKLEVSVERLGRLSKAAVADEAQRLAALRGAGEAAVSVS